MEQQEQTNGRGRAKGLDKTKNQNKYVEGGKWTKDMSVCIVFSVLCCSSEINAKIFLFKNKIMSMFSQMWGLFSVFSASLFQPESDA